MAQSAQGRTNVADRRGEDVKFWENELSVFDRRSKVSTLASEWKLL